MMYDSKNWQLAIVVDIMSHKLEYSCQNRQVCGKINVQ